MTDSKQIAAKWGFGMAPVKRHINYRRSKFVRVVINAIESETITSCDSLPDALSEVKGLFNRTVRTDQWDWYTVHAQLGWPPRGASKKFAKLITEYRSSISKCDDASAKDAILNLKHSGVLVYLREFISPKLGSNCDFVYILSTRELNNFLKIGFTTRSIEQRVKEINSATGVMIPFGARAVWRLKSGRGRFIENLIHGELDGQRVRSDREFFNLEFENARQIIDKIVRQTSSQYRD